MPQVFVAAGSNVRPEYHLALAMRELRASYPDTRVSTAYRNVAVGFDGPDFINLAAGFSTEQSPAEVLTELHRIETLCGRPRLAPKWEPRSMDLDLLLYDELISTAPGMILPRPDLVKRAYMLGPMVEIAGAVVHPTLHRPISELWARFDRAAHPLTAVSLGANA